jgi:hypothetical protein
MRIGKTSIFFGKRQDSTLLNPYLTIGAITGPYKREKGGKTTA